MWASKKGHATVVNVLLEQDAQMHLQANVSYNLISLYPSSLGAMAVLGTTVVHVIFRKCTSELTRCHFNVPQAGYTALMMASEEGHDAVVFALLHHSAQIDMKNEVWFIDSLFLLI